MVKTTGSPLVVVDSMMTKNRDRSDVKLTTHLLPFKTNTLARLSTVYFCIIRVDVSLVPRFILGLQLHVKR